MKVQQHHILRLADKYNHVDSATKWQIDRLLRTWSENSSKLSPAQCKFVWEQIGRPEKRGGTGKIDMHVMRQYRLVAVQKGCDVEVCYRSDVSGLETLWMVRVECSRSEVLRLQKQLHKWLKADHIDKNRFYPSCLSRIGRFNAQARLDRMRNRKAKQAERAERRQELESEIPPEKANFFRDLRDEILSNP